MKHIIELYIAELKAAPEDSATLVSFRGSLFHHNLASSLARQVFHAVLLGSQQFPRGQTPCIRASNAIPNSISTSKRYFRRIQMPQINRLKVGNNLVLFLKKNPYQTVGYENLANN